MRKGKAWGKHGRSEPPGARAKGQDTNPSRALQVSPSYNGASTPGSLSLPPPPPHSLIPFPLQEGVERKKEKSVRAPIYPLPAPTPTENSGPPRSGLCEDGPPSQPQSWSFLLQLLQPQMSDCGLLAPAWLLPQDLGHLLDPEDLVALYRFSLCLLLDLLPSPVC